MRLFLALELGAVVRAELARWQSHLKERCSGWRWVRPAGIHLTLRFLGEVPEELERRCREHWRRVAENQAPLDVHLAGPGTFPERGRPRVLWVGVRDRPPGALERLAHGLEHAAREAGFDPEARPFRPHLTLARARGAERATTLAPWPAPPEVAAPVRELVLFESRLGAGGARYTALAQFPFLAARPPGT